MTDQRLHEICKVIRENTWAGIDESKALCHGCPATIESPYGPGTQGCYLLAQEVFNIAVYGDRLGAVEPKALSVGGTEPTGLGILGIPTRAAPLVCDTKCFDWPRCECGRQCP